MMRTNEKFCNMKSVYSSNLIIERDVLRERLTESRFGSVTEVYCNKCIGFIVYLLLIKN